jgi:hypothetical protein
LVAAAVQWAERIMRKIDNVLSTIRIFAELGANSADEGPQSKNGLK